MDDQAPGTPDRRAAPSDGEGAQAQFAADQVSAHGERWFLRWRLLPQLVFPAIFLLAQVIAMVVLKDVTAGWGIPLILLGGWLMVHGSLRRQRTTKPPSPGAERWTARGGGPLRRLADRHDRRDRALDDLGLSPADEGP